MLNHFSPGLQCMPCMRCRRACSQSGRYPQLQWWPPQWPMCRISTSSWTWELGEVWGSSIGSRHWCRRRPLPCGLLLCLGFPDHIWACKYLQVIWFKVLAVKVMLVRGVLRLRGYFRGKDTPPFVVGCWLRQSKAGCKFNKAHLSLLKPNKGN